MSAVDDTDDQVARRCSFCSTDWPDDKANYAVCPCCREPTSRLARTVPLDDDEALSMKRQFDFEHYYEQEHIPQLELTEREKALIAKAVESAVPRS